MVFKRWKKEKITEKLALGEDADFDSVYHKYENQIYRLENQNSQNVCKKLKIQSWSQW